MNKDSNALNAELTKSAREHEEWIRGVIGHEIKWWLLRLLIVLVNWLFFIAVATSAILALMAITIVLVEKSSLPWAGVLVFLMGVVVMIKVSYHYSGSKVMLITYNAKTPLFIDKSDKKAEATKDEK